MKMDLIDNILGWTTLVTFCLLYISLIGAVLDVWYIQPMIKHIKEKRKDEDLL